MFNKFNKLNKFKRLLDGFGGLVDLVGFHSLSRRSETGAKESQIGAKKKYNYKLTATNMTQNRDYLLGLSTNGDTFIIDRYYELLKQ